MALPMSQYMTCPAARSAWFEVAWATARPRRFVQPCGETFGVRRVVVGLALEPIAFAKARQVGGDDMIVAREVRRDH